MRRRSVVDGIAVGEGDDLERIRGKSFVGDDANGRGA